VLNGNQWWLLNRFHLPENEWFTNYSNSEITFDKSHELKYNDKVQVVFWIDSFRKFHWTEHFKLSEDQNLVMNTNEIFNEFKSLLYDNSFYYLVFLFSVNFLHSLFQFLSLKENYKFYSKLEDNTGLSKSQTYITVIFDFLDLLYLIDNDTSLMVTVLRIGELLLSIWIALKVSRLRLTLSFPFIKSIPQEHTQQEKIETDKSDSKIMKVFLKFFIPLFGIYWVYSLWYKSPSVSFYSFTLEKNMAFIYAFGFVNMIPQIYINYKLKSVEYLPWKALVYKFFNTIIDDIFAFAVKMPFLKRLSCFRDDVIFVIFMYQMYLYRNNKKRNKEIYDEKNETENQKVKEKTE
jgi:hypothetical protein